MRRRVAVVAAVAAATLVVWSVGRTVLPAPPLGRPGGWPTWWSDQGPAVAVFAVLRTAAVAIGLVWSSASVLLLVACSVLAGGRRSTRMARILLRAAERGGRMPGLRGMLRIGVGLAAPGVGLTLGAAGVSAAPATRATSASTGPAGPAPPPAPVLVGPSAPGGETWNPGPPARGPAPTGSLPPGATSRPTTRSPGATRWPGAARPPTASSAAPTLRATSGTAPPGSGSPRPVIGPSATAPPPLSDLSPRALERSRPTTPPVTSTWTVRPGDDFWTIAEMVVGAGSASGESTSVVGGYWLQLMAANRSRLPDPTDPSLLFPGQVLVLPPP